MNTIQNNYSKLSLYAIGSIGLVLIYFFMWRTDAVGYSSVITGDGHDYYSYLMSIFIDKNLGHQDPMPWYVIQTPTGTINVHFIGVSLLLLPFFIIGYLWASFGGFPMTGISEPFQKMISLSALFYALLGLYFLRKILLKLNYTDKITAAVLLLIFFGTHLLNYTINEPAMSHVYSFALIASFLHYSHKMMHSGKLKYFVITGLLLGLIVLVRPINIIVVLILPLWFNSRKEFAARFKLIYSQYKLKVIITKVVFFMVVSLQSVMWFFQNGKLVQWSYKDNGMYFFAPNTIRMLFGFNSGFFVYTPLCLLMLMGLLPMYREQRYQFIIIALFIAFTFYLLSCHWAYTYFDGLSIRALVDFLPVIAIAGAGLLKKVSEMKLRPIALSGVVLTALFNVMICYQYKAGIIQPSSMNFNKFRYILFKTDLKYAGVLGGCNDLRPYAKQHPEPSYTYDNNFYETIFFNYKNKQYGVEYLLPKIGFNTSKLFVKVSLNRREAELNSSENALMVLTIVSPDKKIRNHQNFKLNDTPSSTCCLWKKWYYQITLDGTIKADDKLIVYIWNKEKKEFHIDDFRVEVYNYNYNEQS